MARDPSTHYLKNKEILKEIHKSKMTFCWLADEQYFLYDHIVLSIDEIKDAYNDRERKMQLRLTESESDAMIANEDGEMVRDVEQMDAYEIALSNQASRLQKIAHEAEVVRWQNGELTKKTKPKAAEFAVSIDSIKSTDIVFRVMGYDHIPLEERKKTPKTVADHHSRCNFPAYKHIALINDEWTEVARSHWDGDLETGKFSVTCGHTTERLAMMYMKLCERYSMRGNWRGYTYVDEMRGQAILQLTMIGLQFNELKSQNPFAYFTTVINNSFTRVLNLEKRNQNIRDDLLEEEGLEPSNTRIFNAEWEVQKTKYIPEIGEVEEESTPEDITVEQ